MAFHSLEFGSDPFLIQNSNSCVKIHGSHDVFLSPDRKREGLRKR